MRRLMKKKVPVATKPKAPQKPKKGKNAKEVGKPKVVKPPKKAKPVDEPVDEPAADNVEPEEVTGFTAGALPGQDDLTVKRGMVWKRVSSGVVTEWRVLETGVIVAGKSRIRKHKVAIVTWRQCAPQQFNWIPQNVGSVSVPRMLDECREWPVLRDADLNIPTSCVPHPTNFERVCLVHRKLTPMYVCHIGQGSDCVEGTDGYNTFHNDTPHSDTFFCIGAPSRPLAGLFFNTQAFVPPLAPPASPSPIPRRRRSPTRSPSRGDNPSPSRARSARSPSRGGRSSQNRARRVRSPSRSHRRHTPSPDRTPPFPRGRSWPNSPSRSYSRHPSRALARVSSSSSGHSSSAPSPFSATPNLRAAAVEAFGSDHKVQAAMFWMANHMTANYERKQEEQMQMLRLQQERMWGTVSQLVSSRSDRPRHAAPNRSSPHSSSRDHRRSRSRDRRSSRHSGSRHSRSRHSRSRRSRSHSRNGSRSD